MSEDWLAQVRAEVEQFHRGGLSPPGWSLDRLLACAEALRELVAVHDKPGRYPPSGDRGAAWERARKALRGGDG